MAKCRYRLSAFSLHVYPVVSSSPSLDYEQSTILMCARPYGAQQRTFGERAFTLTNYFLPKCCSFTPPLLHFADFFKKKIYYWSFSDLFLLFSIIYCNYQLKYVYDPLK